MSRTSPVLTGPETSVSCDGSPSGGGVVQPRLLVLLYSCPFHRERWQDHLGPPLSSQGPRPHRRSPATGSPSGGGYVQPRLLAALAAPAIQLSSLFLLLVSTNV